MKSELLEEEKKRLEEKLRKLRERVTRTLEQGRYFGLDRQIRQVQKNYQLIGRI